VARNDMDVLREIVAAVTELQPWRLASKTPESDLVMDFLAQARDLLGEGTPDHVLGDRHADIPSPLPDLSKSAVRVRKQALLTASDRDAIVTENASASNLNKLDLAGTHYEQDLLAEWLIGL